MIWFTVSDVGSVSSFPPVMALLRVGGALSTVNWNVLPLVPLVRVASVPWVAPLPLGALPTASFNTPLLLPTHMEVAPSGMGAAVSDREYSAEEARVEEATMVPLTCGFVRRLPATSVSFRPAPESFIVTCKVGWSPAKLLSVGLLMVIVGAARSTVAVLVKVAADPASASASV